jgi:methyl-accepting chemotaxis protein
MNWYSQLSFRWKLSLPLLILLSIFIYVGLHTVKNTAVLGGYSKTIAKVHLQEIQLLIQADRDLYQALVAQRSLIFQRKGDLATLKKDYADNAQQANDRVNQALSLSIEPSQQERDAFLKLFSHWKSLADQVVAKTDSGTPEDLEAAGQLSYGNANEAFSALRAYIDNLEEIRLKQVEEKTHLVESDIGAIERFTVSTLILVILVAGIAAFHLPYIVVKPLAEMIESIRGIAAGDGDLRQRLQVRSKDELGALAHHLNSFMEKLQSIVREIIQYADIVGCAAQELLSQSTNSQSAVDKQATSISMVVTAVNELTRAIAEVALNTTNTAGNTQQVADNAHRVQGRIRAAVSQVNTLTQRIGETTEVMMRLEQQAKEVMSVIDVIGGVAEQTNLLAHNAAIEAARAGEQGRGFAVVADEVRTLASRTQQSTQDIQNMLQLLQNGVLAAVQSMGASNSTTQDAVLAANEAETALASITEGIKHISDMTIQTATAAEEQSLVTAEIDKNLVEIHDLATYTARDAKRTYEYSQNLSASAAQMKQLVGRFKI